MALTRSDLSAISKVVRDETKPEFDKVSKKIDKLDKKFIRLFDFLDKDWSSLKKSRF